MAPYCVIEHEAGEARLPMKWQERVFFGSPRQEFGHVKDEKWHGMWLVDGPDTAVNERINGRVIYKDYLGRIDFEGQPAVWRVIGNPLAR